MTKNRDKYAIIADTIKENISAIDTGSALGLEIRHGRCRCPIHHGQDFNCVLYKGNRGFYCHRCKVGGDVLKLVQLAMDGMPFIDVLRWFNDTFHMNMDIDSPMDQTALKSAKKRLKCKAENRAFRERIERMDFDLYLLMESILMRLERQRDENQPKRCNDEWNPAFCDAVRMIPEVKRYMEYYAIRSTVIRK